MPGEVEFQVLLNTNRVSPRSQGPNAANLRPQGAGDGRLNFTFEGVEEARLSCVL